MIDTHTAIHQALGPLREQRGLVDEQLRELADAQHKLDAAIAALEALLGGSQISELPAQRRHGSAVDAGENGTDAAGSKTAKMLAATIEILRANGKPMTVAAIFKQLDDMGLVEPDDPRARRRLSDIVARKANANITFRRAKYGMYGLRADARAESDGDGENETPRLTDQIVKIVASRPGITSGGVADALGGAADVDPSKRRVVQTIIGQLATKGRLSKNADGALRVVAGDFAAQ